MSEHTEKHLTLISQAVFHTLLFSYCFYFYNLDKGEKQSLIIHTRLQEAALGQSSACELLHLKADPGAHEPQILISVVGKEETGKEKGCYSM